MCDSIDLLDAPSGDPETWPRPDAGPDIWFWAEPGGWRRGDPHRTSGFFDTFPECLRDFLRATRLH